MSASLQASAGHGRGTGRRRVRGCRPTRRRGSHEALSALRMRATAPHPTSLAIPLCAKVSNCRSVARSKSVWQKRSVCSPALI